MVQAKNSDQKAILVIGWLPCQQPIRRESDTRSGRWTQERWSGEQLGTRRYDIAPKTKPTLLIYLKKKNRVCFFKYRVGIKDGMAENGKIFGVDWPLKKRDATTENDPRHLMHMMTWNANLDKEC